MELTRMKVLYFDLDGTLFDHHHSLRFAIAAMQRNYTGLTEKTVDELIDKYNIALQQAYDAYLDKVITYEEADVRKLHLFFSSLDLPEPSLDEVQKFRDTDKAVYRKNRRATSGSIEALARLREHGYRIAIITNGKPDRRIFQYAIEQLGAPLDTTCMIGDSVESDIKGALDAQLVAIMYSPTAQNSQKLLFGQQIPIIRHMAQLLGYLGIGDH
ncbi:hypothetical protein THAR02_10513 [Trichoderma harzianum]|uniref:HAD family hydrolase n=1 Tax=Trichoderma harzianum TaxID=5544 RepID=A0A0F9Z9T6_TRIHA|nr:hypothetical protein THAR02_10513 [Trichoderma harzianum]